MTSITLRAGPRARAIIAERGLHAADVSAIPAAAGGPKGLVLVPLDNFLFGEWLQTPRRDGQPRWLIGSSVGAWRMAAAAQSDPVSALERFREAYFSQTYPKKPTAHYVSVECGRTASAALGDSPHWEVSKRLVVITAKSRGILGDKGSAARFAAAALSNAVSRRQLARYFERVLFLSQAHECSDELRAMMPLDAFGGTLAEFTERNAHAALLASGTIPMLAEAVRSPDGAPPGLYWDGGMVDYHLNWDWQALPGMVLYPHFVDHVVPGWLDKHLPWRRAKGRHLDNLLIVSPSAELLARLPRRKLPDRDDFYHFGLDYAARIRCWQQALGECQRMADDFADFLARPDLARVLPLR